MRPAAAAAYYQKAAARFVLAAASGVMALFTTASAGTLGFWRSRRRSSGVGAETVGFLRAATRPSGSPLRSRHSRPRPARPRGASPGRASCGAASPLAGARRRPGARRRRGLASSSGRPWRPWVCGAALLVCTNLWLASPLLCAAVPGLPPPVGLPPQRAAGRTNVRAHECSPLGGQAIRTGAIRATFGARRSMQR